MSKWTLFVKQFGISWYQPPVFLTSFQFVSYLQGLLIIIIYKCAVSYKPGKCPELEDSRSTLCAPSTREGHGHPAAPLSLAAAAVPVCCKTARPSWSFQPLGPTATTADGSCHQFTISHIAIKTQAHCTVTED